MEYWYYLPKTHLKLLDRVETHAKKLIDQPSIPYVWRDVASFSQHDLDSFKRRFSYISKCLCNLFSFNQQTLKTMTPCNLYGASCVWDEFLVKVSNNDSNTQVSRSPFSLSLSQPFRSRNRDVASGSPCRRSPDRFRLHQWGRRRRTASQASDPAYSGCPSSGDWLGRGCGKARRWVSWQAVTWRKRINLQS